MRHHVSSHTLINNVIAIASYREFRIRYIRYIPRYGYMPQRNMSIAAVQCIKRLRIMRIG